MYQRFYNSVIRKTPDRIVESTGGPFLYICSRFVKKPIPLPFRIGRFEFEAPVGMPSGWADSPQKVNTIKRLGAGVVIIKTVTPEKKQGNPYPRIIRGDNMLINSMGLPNKGSDWWLQNGPGSISSPVILSIKADSISDWISLIATHEKWVDIFELNFSCPNVGNGIMDISRSADIIKEISSISNKPLWLKLSPEYSPQENLKFVERVRESIFGVTLINTLPVQNNKLGNPAGVGGLSGFPLRKHLMNHLDIFRKTYPSFDELPIFSTGGLDVQDAYSIIKDYSAIPFSLTNFLIKSPLLYIKMRENIIQGLEKDGLNLSNLLNN